MDTIKTETNDVLDMSLLCRICGATSDYLIPIFEGEGQENDLCQKIADYLPIKVLKKNRLPEQTCYQCASTLLAWHDLVQCCIQADLTLREKLKLAHPRQAKKKIKQSSVKLEENIGMNENTVVDDAATERLLPCEEKIERKPTTGGILHENNANDSQTNDYDSDQMSSTKDEREMSSDVSEICFSSDHSDHEDSRPIISSVIGNYGKNMSERNCLVTCYFCQKKIVAKTLYSHLRRHATEKIHTCESCGNCYKAYANLTRHIREVHQNFKNYVCPHCNKKYSRSNMLHDHIRIRHTKERPHMCDICGKAFHTLAHHFLHKKNHIEKDRKLLESPGNEGRKLQCLICLKHFKKSSALYNHRLVHLKERPHPCRHCPRKYKVHWKLSAHMKFQHPDIVE